MDATWGPHAWNRVLTQCKGHDISSYLGLYHYSTKITLDTKPFGCMFCPLGEETKTSRTAPLSLIAGAQIPE